MNKNKSIGYMMAFSSYLIWGVLAIYWKQLSHLSSGELLATRIIASVITLLIVVHSLKNPKYMDYLRDKSIRRKLLLSAVLVSINWAVFVYAVNAGYVLQASLGYYINPLVSVFLGIFVLKERLSKIQYVAIVLAASGVLYMTFGYGEFPWISLVLAFSFGLYGLLKKLYHLDSLNSLLVETMYFAPFMIVVLMGSNPNVWVEGVAVHQHFMVLLAGVITVVPLLLFSEGAKRIPLSTIGFLQYIAPTMMLLIGVLMYGEAFTEYHAISFGMIWSGLVVFSIHIIRTNRHKDKTTEFEVVIELADEEDAKDILDLQKKAFLSEAALNNDYEIPPLVETYETFVQSFDEWTYLKIMDGSKLIGSVRGKLMDDTCHIGRVIVDDAYQNKGIGTKLMKAIETSFADVKRFELFTGTLSAKNIYLYEKLGYRKYKEESINDKSTLVFMEK